MGTKKEVHDGHIRVSRQLRDDIREVALSKKLSAAELATGILRPVIEGMMAEKDRRPRRAARKT